MIYQKAFSRHFTRWCEPSAATKIIKIRCLHIYLWNIHNILCLRTFLCILRYEMETAWMERVAVATAIVVFDSSECVYQYLLGNPLALNSSVLIPFHLIASTPISICHWNTASFKISPFRASNIKKTYKQINLKRNWKLALLWVYLKTRKCLLVFWSKKIDQSYNAIIALIHRNVTNCRTLIKRSYSRLF